MNDTRLFRKRPIPVTARQLTGESFREIVDALTPDQFVAGGENTNGAVFLQVRTLEGVVHASENDWITWGNHGDVWPVRGSIFAETYEPVTAQPPTNQAALRDRIAESLYVHDHPGWATRYADLDQDERDTYLARADAVLAVLPEPTGRAAVLAATLREVLDTFGPMHEVYGGPVSYYEGSADIEPEQYERWRAVLDGELRRLAAEAQPTTKPEPAEPEAAVTMHAIPLPGSSGISSCCGRPPCEFVGERVTRDPDKVTCPRPAAGVRQDGAQSS